MDGSAQKDGLYQSKIPSDFRHASYVIEAVLQMKAMREVYNSYHIVLFDRWFDTNIAYLDSINWYSEYFKMLTDLLPKPNLTYFFKLDTSKALKRLKEKNDWMLKMYDENHIISLLNKRQSNFEQLYRDREDVIHIDSNGMKKDVINNVICSFTEYMEGLIE